MDNESDRAELIAAFREGLQPLVNEMRTIIAEIRAMRMELRAEAEQLLLDLETLTTKTIH